MHKRGQGWTKLRLARKIGSSTGTLLFNLGRNGGGINRYGSDSSLKFADDRKAALWYIDQERNRDVDFNG